MIKVFTPSFADEADTNAQNLTVKEVVSRLDPAEFQVTLLHENVPDPRIVARRNTRILRWKQHGNTLRTVARLLQEVPDVYFFPREGPLDTAFLKLRRWLGLHTSLVTYVVSGGELEHGKPRATLARNIQEGDIVVGNSTYMSQLLRERMGINASAITDAADSRFFFPSEVSTVEDKGLAVLFAGSFRPYKRAHVVVQQAALWPRVQFLLAGRGEEEERCRQLASDHGCNNVRFLGHLSSSQLGEQMRKANVFFFPSVVEGHPQVLVQAAASGLPVVAMNHYYPDYVVDGKTGFLVSSDTDLAEKLKILLTQPDRRLQMRRAAIAHSQQFNWDSITVQWQQAFVRAMNSRGKGRNG
jgi:glycosyltransferase involved in cell wall biosynthesis